MKTLCTYVLSIAFLAIANCGVVNAQPGTVYNKYFINQDFDGVSALPAGWSGDAGNSNIFTKGGGAIAFRDGMMVMSGAGGGNRGTQVTVPATDSNEAWTGYTTWFIELDWTVNKGVLGRRNAVHLTFLGNGTQNPNNGTTWYADALFGIYTFGDDLVHYWNMDSETPAFLGGSGPSFNKGAADLAATSALNASTATTLAFATGVTYHITAELDFQNQKVVSLTITEKDNPANTVTVTDKPFLAPTLGGSESAVAVENRKPKNFSVLTCVNTRGSNDGNGDNVDLEAYVDNLQVYVKETSLG
ncbi:MAG: hypothetical protein LBD45_06765, partial [Bacteroidales bacterium]|nr:hypothetical protein [Bacteroidales bacterium]